MAVTVFSRENLWAGISPLAFILRRGVLITWQYFPQTLSTLGKGFFLAHYHRSTLVFELSWTILQDFKTNINWPWKYTFEHWIIIYDLQYQEKKSGLNARPNYSIEATNCTYKKRRTIHVIRIMSKHIQTRSTWVLYSTFMVMGLHPSLGTFGPLNHPGVPISIHPIQCSLHFKATCKAMASGHPPIWAHRPQVPTWSKVSLSLHYAHSGIGCLLLAGLPTPLRPHPTGFQATLARLSRPMRVPMMGEWICSLIFIFFPFSRTKFEGLVGSFDSKKTWLDKVEPW